MACLPISLYVDSAQPYEITLSEPTLHTLSDPRKHGRPSQRPKELVADKADDSAAFPRQLPRGIKPTIPSFKWRKHKKPKRACTFGSV